MKKIIAFLLVGIMVLGCAGCSDGSADGAGTENEKDTEVKIEITDANDILTKAWEKYEANKFEIMGGHFESAAEGSPNTYDLSKKEDLEQMYCVPVDVSSMIHDAATMVDMMKASAFTAGAYHVADVENVQSVIDGIKAATLANDWQGNPPEILLIVTVSDNYVVSAFGDAEVVNVFKNALVSIYGNEVVVAEEEGI